MLPRRSDHEATIRHADRSDLSKRIAHDMPTSPIGHHQAVSYEDADRKVPETNQAAIALGNGAIRAASKALREAGFGAIQLKCQTVEPKGQTVGGALRVIHSANIRIAASMPWAESGTVGTKDFGVNVSFDDGQYHVASLQLGSKELPVRKASIERIAQYAPGYLPPIHVKNAVYDTVLDNATGKTGIIASISADRKEVYLSPGMQGGEHWWAKVSDITTVRSQRQGQPQPAKDWNWLKKTTDRPEISESEDQAREESIKNYDPKNPNPLDKKKVTREGATLLADTPGKDKVEEEIKPNDKEGFSTQISGKKGGNYKRHWSQTSKKEAGCGTCKADGGEGNCTRCEKDPCVCRIAGKMSWSDSFKRNAQTDQHLSSIDYQKAFGLAKACIDFQCFVDACAKQESEGGINVRFQNVNPNLQKQMKDLFADAQGQRRAIRKAQTDQHLSSIDYQKAFGLAKACTDFQCFVDACAKQESEGGINVRFQNVNPNLQKQMKDLFADAQGQRRAIRNAQTELRKHLEGAKRIAQSILTNPSDSSIVNADSDMEILRRNAADLQWEINKILGQVQAYQDGLAAKKAAELGLDQKSFIELQAKASSFQQELESKLKSFPQNFIRFSDGVLMAKKQNARLNDASWKDMIEAAKERGKGVMRRVVLILDRIALLFKKMTSSISITELSPDKATAKDLDKITKSNVANVGKIDKYQQDQKDIGPTAQRYFLDNAEGQIQQPGGRSGQSNDPFTFLQSALSELNQCMDDLASAQTTLTQVGHLSDRQEGVERAYPLPGQQKAAGKLPGFSSVNSFNGSLGVRRHFAQKK